MEGGVPPALPHDVLVHVIAGAGPRAWGAASLVCSSWRSAARACWATVTHVAIDAAAGGGVSACLSSRTDDPSPAVTAEAVVSLVCADGESELDFLDLERLLALTPRVRALSVSSVRLSGAPAAGYERAPGQDPSDALLGLVVHLVRRCAGLRALALRQCSGSALAPPPALLSATAENEVALTPATADARAEDAPAAAAAAVTQAEGAEAQGAEDAPAEDDVPPEPLSEALRELQLCHMDGLSRAGARWLLPRCPAMRALDVSWSDTDLGELDALPPAIESLDCAGCFALGEPEVRPLLASAAHARLVHLSLPTGMPLGVALDACAALPRLRALTCAGAYSDRGAAVLELAHAELRTLNLSALLLNHACRLETRCPRLVSLDVHQDPFVFEGLAAVRLHDAERLEALDIRWNARASLAATGALPALRTLLLEGCTALSAAGLYTIVQRAPHISQLEMGECDGLRAEPALFALAFAHALRATPTLRYTLPSGVQGVGLEVPPSSLDASFP